jgi:O-antigen/teichoic acid export membrane protein
MNTSTRIHWGRVWIGGFLAEVAIFAVFIPAVLLFGEGPARYTVPAAALVMTFLSAVWAGRRIESGFVLHGILVGAVATLLYLALTLAQPEPLIYLVAHGLKILGGAAGGRVAEKRKRMTIVPEMEGSG